ncbi:oxidoreductase GFO/IDH/MOCA family [Butyrivibrio proteoclasticus B316]|uniref:Oxidoreductase GFO/IDH/MOCA family n=2 Tax=Butyrivibrio proteoclasticus TaxID=43305 RepID=E0RZI2_BUTPB|nr:oxidoreductase GFO/IDH/MOCA family [Butyrivibrio proteoclasticus B316]
MEMKRYKVLFVGIGSIARRHIRNMLDIGEQIGAQFEIDAFRRGTDKDYGISDVYQEISDVPDDYDIVFITNPTELHLASIEQFNKKGKNFFIEKPVVSLGQISNARKFEPKIDSVYYVACPLRYNAVINYIKDNIDLNDVISVRSISSSYLPDWRPGQDYRDTYSAHRDLGGGVSIDLIHEWDYLSYLFGFPNSVKSMIGRVSDLEIDSDDYAIYIAQYDKMVAELHLDYFGRNTIREIQLFTREDTIIGDIVGNSIRFLKEGREISFDENRDDYQKRELMHFLDIIEGKTSCDSDYYHALKVLELTQGNI